MDTSIHERMDVKRMVAQCFLLIFFSVILFLFTSCLHSSCSSIVPSTKTTFGNNEENMPIFPNPSMPNNPPSDPPINKSIEKICSIGKMKDIGTGSDFYPLKLLLEPLEIPKDTPLACYHFSENGKPNAAGDSWGTAFASSRLKEKLDNTLATENKVYLFLLGKGTYKPTTSTDRNISFNMKNYIVIIGGWDNSYENDITMNRTILSGDIGISKNRNDNSYHVIRNNNLNKSAVLYGVTVSGGYADGSTNINTSGAGMYNNNSNPTIIQSTFSDNSTSDRSIRNGNGGGAIYNSNSNSTITKSFFIGNSVKANSVAGRSNNGGGAIYNNNSSVTITQSTFINNSSGYSAGGGAVFNNNSKMTITQSSFIDNSAYRHRNGGGGSGGSINVFGSSDVRLHDLYFRGNHSERHGGAIYIYDSDVTITESIFNENFALWGGTISSEGNVLDSSYSSYSHVKIMQSTFSSNNAAEYGGAILNMRKSDMRIILSTFSNNAAEYGGAIQNRETNMKIIRSTLNNNSAGEYGGAINIINLFSNSKTILANVIVWGNTASKDGAQIYMGLYGNYNGMLNLTLGSVVLQGGVELIGFSEDAKPSRRHILYSNVVFEDPSLDIALADNGGVMWTVALLGSSSAINKGLYIKIKKNYSVFYYSKNGITWYTTPAIESTTGSVIPPSDTFDLNTDARGFFSGRPDIGSFEYGGIPHSLIQW